jgi:hypothetical protein
MSEFRKYWEEMRNVPELERNLQVALNILNQATSKKKNTKQTAVRFFNRLYYDLSRWNAEFTGFLKKYPGFREDPTEQEFEAFEEEFSRFADRLDSRGYYRRGDGYDLESDICLRINFLSARLRNDFEWLRQEEPDAYRTICFAVGHVVYHPMHPSDQGISSALYRSVETLSHEIFGDKWSENKKPPNQSKIKQAIETYIYKSNASLDKIGAEARKIGFLLLSVTEYEEALQKEGSSNPNLFVLGEVTVTNEAPKYDLRNSSFPGGFAETNYGKMVETQNNYSSEQKQTLTEASAEIQSLLKQLEQSNPRATEAEQVMYINDETTPSFKRRVTGALQASGEAAIDEFILENKYLKVAKAAVKGWLQAGA